MGWTGLEHHRPPQVSSKDWTLLSWRVRVILALCRRHHFNCELLWFASDCRSLAFIFFCKVTSLSVLLISYGLSPAVVFARKIKHLHLKASPFSLFFQHAAFSLCASLGFFFWGKRNWKLIWIFLARLGFSSVEYIVLQGCSTVISNAIAFLTDQLDPLTCRRGSHACLGFGPASLRLLYWSQELF